MSTSHFSIILLSFSLSERNACMYENYVLKSIDLLSSKIQRTWLEVEMGMCNNVYSAPICIRSSTYYSVRQIPAWRGQETCPRHTPKFTSENLNPGLPGPTNRTIAPSHSNAFHSTWVSCYGSISKDCKNHSWRIFLKYKFGGLISRNFDI